MSESNVPPPPSGPNDPYDTAPASAPPPPPNAGMLNPTPTPMPPPSDAPPLGYAAPSTAIYMGPPPDQDSKTMGMLSHLLGILLGFLGPLIIWLIKKDSHPFVNDQGKEALNFQLTLLIGYLIAAATSCVLIGMFIFPVVWLVGLILSIMGTMKAYGGEAYRYPLNIRFIK